MLVCKGIKEYNMMLGELTSRKTKLKCTFMCSPTVIDGLCHTLH